MAKKKRKRLALKKMYTDELLKLHEELKKYCHAGSCKKWENCPEEHIECKPYLDQSTAMAWATAVHCIRITHYIESINKDFDFFNKSKDVQSLNIYLDKTVDYRISAENMVISRTAYQTALEYDSDKYCYLLSILYRLDTLLKDLVYDFQKLQVVIEKKVISITVANDKATSVDSVKCSLADRHNDIRLACLGDEEMV